MDTQLHRSAAPGFLPRHVYPTKTLTTRDRDIIALVLAGHTNAEIARRLNIQLQTLKNTLSSIYTKLGVSTRLQLAVLLLRDRLSFAAPAATGTLPGDGTSPAGRTASGSLRL
jgi:DNA-binding CsgD family transcriptional regulator